MAESLNQQIADALTMRQLQVGRIELHQRRDIVALLAILETDLLGALKQEDPTESPLLARRRRVIEDLMADLIAVLIGTRYRRIATTTTAFLVRLAEAEATFVTDVLNDIVGDETIVDLPSVRRLRAGIVAMRIPTPTRPTDLSATGDEWWQRQADGLTQRIRDSLLVGVGLEETLPQLVARVRGTQANGFRDGIMERARLDARRLLTTQVTNAVSEARVRLAEANPDKGLVLEHHSVLDSRTSLICLGRHGKRYTLDTHEPIGHSLPYLNGVPYHPNCRSSIDPVLRTGGGVAQESLSAWLRRQSVERQNAILGRGRADLWRAGRLSQADLLDAATGRPLTLEELQP